MKNTPPEVETKIEDLQAEQVTIEDRTTHQGFRDASRRNRIEEQIGQLDEIRRKSQSSLPNTAAPGLNGDKRVSTDE